MKYCIHCGKEVLDDAIICPACGCSVQYDNMGGFSKSNNSAQQNYVPPFEDNYSGLSVAGLVLSFFSPLIGLILSICAHNEAKRMNSEKSLSMSKAGIIISSVILGIIAVCVLIWIVILISLIAWVP